MYATVCSATARDTPVSITHATAVSGTVSRSSTARRMAETSPDSSRVRPGASPNQNGIVGGWPWASSTRTVPVWIRRIFQGVLPNRKMSPAMLSMAKSSFTVPTIVPSGSAMTR